MEKLEDKNLTPEERKDWNRWMEREETRRRSQSGWYPKYQAFLKAGYAEDEAKWGADHRLPLRDSKVKTLMAHRAALVSLNIERFGQTREKAIEMASMDSESKLERTRDSYL